VIQPEKNCFPRSVLSLRCDSRFSRWTWVRGYPNVSFLDVIGAKDDRGAGDYWSNKTCKAPVKSIVTTNNQHPAFYRPDAFPVAQPSVSKHWTEIPRSVVLPKFTTVLADTVLHTQLKLGPLLLSPCTSFPPPFSTPFFPFHYLFPSFSLPYPSPPFSPSRGPGESCNSHSGVRDEILGANEFLTIFTAENASGDNKFSNPTC